jgi:hypothetical protein
MIFLTFVMLQIQQRKKRRFCVCWLRNFDVLGSFVVHKCHRLMPFMHVLSGKFMLRDGLDFVL